MSNLRFLQLGWVLALALIGVMLAGGFQTPTEKTGVVDFSKFVDDSDVGKQVKQEFADMKSAREGLLEFIDTYRVLTPEQAQKIRDLSLKTDRTPADNAALDSAKADVIAQSKKSTELSTKSNLTPEDRALLEEYARRSQNMNDTAQRWLREFGNEMQSWMDKQKLMIIDKARVAIADVAKQQGYTIVFEVGVAPYGANDLTQPALDAMNAKK